VVLFERKSTHTNKTLHIQNNITQTITVLSGSVQAIQCCSRASRYS